MKYSIDFVLPDNDTVRRELPKTFVKWSVWGYSGLANAKESIVGKWIDDGFLGRKTCSICGTWIANNTGTAKLNYCPNCGADNRGEQNG